MVHPSIDAILRHWRAQRGDATVPRRADIDPRAFHGALSHSFMAERMRPGVVRIRVAGQHLSDLMGMETRGMPLRAFFEIADRGRLMPHVEAVFERPATLSAEIVSDTPTASPLEGRLVLLPLADHQSVISRAMGAIVTDGPVGRPPRRFRLRAVEVSPLDGSPEPTPPHRSLAEAQTAYRTDRRGPLLHVVQGGKRD